MATAVAHLHTPSLTTPEVMHETTIWDLPDGAVVTSCTCPHSLYRPDAAPCAHRKAIEVPLLAFGFLPDAQGRLTYQPTNRTTP